MHPNLVILKCSNNQLMEYSFDNLPSGIEILDCSYNELVNLDYLPPSIVKLNCSHNQIIQLDNLPCLMEYLTITSNPIVKLENLPSSITYFKMVGCNKFKNKISNPHKMLEKVIIINNNTNNNELNNFITLPNIKSIIVGLHNDIIGINETKNLIK